MSHAAISLLVLGAVVVLFVWNRLPVEVVAIGSAIVLYLTGVITMPDMLAGFGDPTIVLIAALFVVSEGLEATGVTTWVGQVLMAGAGDSARRLLVLTMVLVAALTAVINLNGAVAALLPMVVVIAVRRGIAPSKLLMPLAFAGSAGSLLLLTGSPVNVIISDSAEDAGVGAFGFAEFAIVGVPLVVGTLLVITLFGHRLLPDRTSAILPPDLSGYAATLTRQYALGRVLHAHITVDSPLVGTSRGAWDLSGYDGINIVTVTDAATTGPVSDGTHRVGDRLTIVGDRETASRFAGEHLLDVAAELDHADVAKRLIDRGNGAVEVVIPPRSQLVGEPVHAGQVVEGRIVVLAVHRQGRDQGATTTVLRAGDVILLEGPWDELEVGIARDGFLVVNDPDLVRRQTVPLGKHSVRAMAILGVMIAALATGVVAPVLAALLAAGAMIVSRVLTVEQSYRRISWTTVLLVAGMIPLSTAIRTSGAGEMVAELLVAAVGDAGPTMLLVALFALTVVFGQLISNTATALVVIPIAVSAAAQLGVSAAPVLMSVCVASAAAFLTPVATPANMMVMAPAGYRFGDYWKLGIVMIGLFFVVSVGLVPLVWNF
ncbi:SLC13 family permease [Prescottella defluvii]|uniref:SLC13 family permease n=1 Tax=Prescottella defluvii TaxID=1323361 RepID=UPI0004F35839|nr:SLC13 family permease [Prescottella defluvii]